MTGERPPIEPLRSAHRLLFYDQDELDLLQDASLRVLEEVGVRFPSKKAQTIFGDHGAVVDLKSEIVKLPRDVALKAIESAPRHFTLGSLDQSFDLQLQEGVTYCATDGCGYETIDFKTGELRPSCKADVANSARMADYLSSIAFYWPMVSAQDYGNAAPLHELDASWNNTVKHVQTETLMGEISARYAIEMALAISGDEEKLRRRPPFSSLICTIAPLMQDKEGIEGALLFAEAGIPVGFMAMPTLGTTAPTTLPGAFVVGDAEVISACVLMQLASPGAPVYYSLIPGYADPRSGSYISYPRNARGRFEQCELAHHWGLPFLAGAFGTESERPGTWQAAADVALDPFLVGLSGSDFATGLGMNNSYTLLSKEGIVLDDEIYHRARYALLGSELSEETLTFETIRDVGPGGHFLSQKHTRKSMKDLVEFGLAHQRSADGKFRDPVEVACEKADWILENHHPEPLDETKQTELVHILHSAEQELSTD
jgi:trimethylamine--corrinoid protein Co-methyltransferase